MAEESDEIELLEFLNAQIDVWIDEEHYDLVAQHLICDDKATANLAAFFPAMALAWVNKRPDGRCTYRSKQRGLFGVILCDRPVAAVVSIETEPTVRIELAKDPLWSTLFWAKLLRARIQEQGTDCYFSRLDDIAIMLENHLPLRGLTSETPAMGSERLAVLYLLELSALSEPKEALGFAQRAKRAIRGITHNPKKGTPTWFYQLWAHYNCGVSYLHDGQFDQALSEFDYVLHDLKEFAAGEIDSIDGRCGRPVTDLLYYPSILARAETMLKLQLPFHALETLRNHPLYRPHSLPDDAQGSRRDVPYKHLQALLIVAEAFQQMDLLGDMRRCIDTVERSVQGHQNTKAQNVVGRLVALEIDHCLAKIADNVDGDDASLDQLVNRIKKLFRDHYRRAAASEPDRGGFYEQLSKSLAQLAKLKPPEGIPDGERKRRYEGRLRTAAIDQYRLYVPDLLASAKLKERHGPDRPDSAEAKQCPHCLPLHALDLGRLPQQNYESFTDAMKTFYARSTEWVRADATAGAPVLSSKAAEYLSSNIRADKVTFVGWVGDVQKHQRLDIRAIRHDLYRSLLDSDSGIVSSGACGNCRGRDTAFDGLLGCAGQIAGGENALSSDHYEDVIRGWFKRFQVQLGSRTVHEPRHEGLHLVGLQRWNSSSPAEGQSLGGGYLLYSTDRAGRVGVGVAIDPGFDFVRNLFSMGFGLSDIDVVVVTHSHVDHCRDLESMIVLLGELAKRADRKRKVHVVLTQAVYHRIGYLMESPFYRDFIEPYVIDLDRDIDRTYFEELPSDRVRFDFYPSARHTSKTEEPTCHAASQVPTYRAACQVPTFLANSDSPSPESAAFPSVVVQPTRAYHNDHSGYSDSFGLLITVSLDESTKLTIGYTGDTRWLLEQDAERFALGRIVDPYIGKARPDVILVHLGSAIPENKRFSTYADCVACEGLIQQVNHPYLPGMLMLVTTIAKSAETRLSEEPVQEVRGQRRPLILVSEFGEELRTGIRADLIRRLREAFRGLDFLPLDVGMDVQLWTKLTKEDEDAATPSVRCVVCERYVSPDKAEFENYGEDEGLYCVCKTCRRGTPLNVRQDRLRHLYEIGRDLVPAKQDASSR